MMREVLIGVLGGRCACLGPDCCHDGPCPVDDIRCLQLDHVKGDGARDRERLGQAYQVARYYFNHLDEARENLHVLCANCNWVKRTRNKEVRNGHGRDVSDWERISDEAALLRMTGHRVAGTPRFMELVDKYHGFKGHLISRTADTDMVSWLEGIGLSDSSRRPLAISLAHYWKKLGTYGGSSEELDRFVVDCIVNLDSLVCAQGVREQGRCAGGKR